MGSKVVPGIIEDVDDARSSILLSDDSGFLFDVLEERSKRNEKRVSSQSLELEEGR